MTEIERFRIDGEPVRRFFLVAEVTFADREAQPRDEYDHNYYEDRELVGLVDGWMSDAVNDRDDSPQVRFHGIQDPLLLAAVKGSADGQPVPVSVMLTGEEASLGDTARCSSRDQWGAQCVFLEGHDQSGGVNHLYPSPPPPVVAYRSPGTGSSLWCREHKDLAQKMRFVPLTSEDLPYGGICTFVSRFRLSPCGRDVLA